MSDISKLSMQPAVTEMQLQDIVKRNYNLKVGILHRYEGYSDMNYRVETTISDDDDDNDDDDFDKKDKPVVTIKKLVLKILNREDSRFPECFEGQLKIMAYAKSSGVPVPVPVETVNGAHYCKETLTVKGSDIKAEFLVSLVEHLPGKTFREAGCPLYLLPDIGRLTGKLDMVLKAFDVQEKIGNDSLWQLTKLPALTALIHRHCGPVDRTMGLSILQDYNDRILPVLDQLQSGLIHGDVNKHNIIVLPVETDSKADPVYVISGLIDFADASFSYYIYELATLMADIMTSYLQDDPVNIGGIIFNGYAEAFNLNEYEISVLRLCVCVRLLQSYVLRSETMLKEPGNAYLNRGREESLDLCRCIWQMTDEEFLRKIQN